MIKRLMIGLVAAAASALFAQPALAASATVSGNVNAGTLSISTSATPSFSVTLDGTDKTGSYTVPTTVTDATGSGAGWNLTITSTQFTITVAANIAATAVNFDWSAYLND